ncbi:MAG TPA: helix-turn-helix domain-containing protein [Candidatus Saccharimonadales bacterium]|nr:helix-turn-helix domain-containing protein [Candidatus Saccharimonadales bacterium]
MSSIESIQHYLAKLQIAPETTEVYVALITLGPSSALQLAKKTGVTRTSVYRHLESLQAVGLASAEELTYGTLYRSLPLENIEGLLADREAETRALRTDLKSVSETLQTIAGSTGPKATVQHYYGLAGLKQINWNLVSKANKECRVFAIAELSQHLDKAFTRRCRERLIERGLVSYDLVNSPKVTFAQYEPFEPSRTFIRYIDPQILRLNFEVFLYNDVVTLVDYSAEQQLALEIHHPTLHALMRQLFDAMWSQGRPLTIER